MANDLTTSASTVDKRSLYARDYYSRALHQARALKGHWLEELDWENLSDEARKSDLR